MKIAIIGGGPAGLRAAEIAVAGGAEVTLYDAKPSTGRKFLVAGRGGLNLSNEEEAADFAKRFTAPSAPEGFWDTLIREFDSLAMRAWARGLDVETFVASTGKIYPKELKAAPLLRRWVQRLRNAGVTFAMNHRWTGLSAGSPIKLLFDVGGKQQKASADVVILALGGGSWPETGSDGGWAKILSEYGIGISPLEPANCGWNVDWPAEMLPMLEGQPIKNISVRASYVEVRGELLATRDGLEGGAIYQLGAALRDLPRPAVTIDFKPDSTMEQLLEKMESARGDFLDQARPRWRLGDVAYHLLKSRGPYASVYALATEVKRFTLLLAGPRPLPEAISTAGGVRWDETGSDLMLKKLPGVFVAGEMLDWEAPTGGYLIHGCFATGARAAESALRWGMH